MVLFDKQKVLSDKVCFTKPASGITRIKEYKSFRLCFFNLNKRKNRRKSTYRRTFDGFLLGIPIIITNYFCGNKSVFAVLNSHHRTYSTLSVVCLAKT